MKSARTLEGLPVIRDGQRIGRVGGVCLSEDLRAVKGLWMRHGLSGCRYVENAQILLFGDVSVVSASLGVRYVNRSKPLFRRAVSTDGSLLGAITDAFLDPDTREICALELSASIYEDITNGRRRVSQYTVRTNGDVVVDEPTEGGDSQ